MCAKRNDQHGVSPRFAALALAMRSATVDVGSASRRELEQLNSQPVNYVKNDFFAAAEAEQVVMADPDASKVNRPTSGKSSSDTATAKLCRENVLTPAEEQCLFRRMNYLKHQAAQLQAELDDDKPSLRKLRKFAGFLTQAQKVRNRIVTANLRLVVATVKRFTNWDAPFDDCISEGIDALFQAVDNFDYDRGFRFSTYATRAMRSNLSRWIARNRRIRERVMATDSPTIFELEPARHEGAASEAKDLKKEKVVNRVLKHLDSREERIIRDRFALGEGRRTKSLQKIANELGVSKERVRQIEKRALGKLREFADSHGLDDAVLL